LDCTPQFAGEAQVAVDGSGSPVLAGPTDSPDFPVLNQVQSPEHSEGGYVFVSRFSPNLSEVIYSTRLGGYNAERAIRLAVDSGGQAFAAFERFSQRAPLPEERLSACTDVLVTEDRHDLDVLLVVIPPDAASAGVRSVQIGGTSTDIADAIALGPDNKVYLGGQTRSPVLPPGETGLNRLPGTGPAPLHDQRRRPRLWLRRAPRDRVPHRNRHRPGGPRRV
jgi:hypothetical protein